MSGTLIVQEDATWMPTGWIFDNILREIAHHLPTTERPLAALLLVGQTAVNGGFVDLRDLDPAAFGALQVAAELAYVAMVHAGPDAFFAPAAYPECMCFFSALRALFSTDPRAVAPERTTGLLLVNAQATWTADWWLFDLLIEQVAARLRLADEALSNDLVAARVAGGSARADLRQLEAARFGALLREVEFIHARQTHAPVAYAPAFYQLVNPRVGELLQLLSTDPRAADRTALAATGEKGADLPPIGVDPRTGVGRPLERITARDLETVLAQRQVKGQPSAGAGPLPTRSPAEPEDGGGVSKGV